jgi:hypothetical protein
LSVFRKALWRPFGASTVEQFHDQKIRFYPDNCRTSDGEIVALARAIRKRNGTPYIQTAPVAVVQEEESDQEIFVVDWCECGNIITQRARALQDSDLATKKLCFNCLLHKRKIGVIERKKDGWVT